MKHIIIHSSSKIVPLWFPLLLGGLLFAAGCGRDDRPAMGDVQGAVTLDGRPLDHAKVTFRPLAGGRTSYAFTDANGHYQLIFLRDIKGAVLGKHQVRFYKAAEESSKDVIPSRYNQQSDIEREVGSGSNIFDFDLKSGD